MTSLIQVREPKGVKNRLHTDVQVARKGKASKRWARIIEAAYRLTAAGATVLREDQLHHVVMADPEGNAFGLC
jgi:hypothetical protein